MIGRSARNPEYSPEPERYWGKSIVDYANDAAALMARQIDRESLDAMKGQYSAGPMMTATEFVFRQEQRVRELQRIQYEAARLHGEAFLKY